MLDDPLRAQVISFSAGLVLAAVVLAVCTALAVLRPGDALGSAPILMARESGALHVRIGDTVHPVLNLASARLVAGVPADPEPVGAAAIAAAARGPLVGIPGAPTQIDPALNIEESGFTLCDRADVPSTVLIAGPLRDGTRPWRPGQAVLVTPRGESAATTYLLYDGSRAAVDLRDMAAVRALRLEGLAPVPVSRSLLDSLREVPAVAAPPIPDAGAPGPPALGGLAVGNVVRVARASLDAPSSEFYVVLGGGLQRVGAIAADLIRFTVAQTGGEPPLIAAGTAAAVPFVDSLPVATFPERVRQPEDGVICAGWNVRDTGMRSTLIVGDSLPVPDNQRLLPLAQADQAGPNVDGIVFPAGRSMLVRATGLAGDGGTPGPLYLVNDLGVRFGIQNDTAAQQLGLAGPAVAAPWSMLTRLPPGPELSTQAASVVRDGLAIR